MYRRRLLAGCGPLAGASVPPAAAQRALVRSTSLAMCGCAEGLLCSSGRPRAVSTRVHVAGTGVGCRTHLVPPPPRTCRQQVNPQSSYAHDRRRKNIAAAHNRVCLTHTLSQYKPSPHIITNLHTGSTHHTATIYQRSAVVAGREGARRQPPASRHAGEWEEA